MKALYLGCTPLRNVKGRIKYITGETGKQEHLYAVSGNLDMEFWQQLAKESQETFEASGNNRLQKKKRKDGSIYFVQQKACEAKEIIMHLENTTEENAQEVADDFVAWFKETYGVECCAAIHNNKTKKNIHIHLIYAERELMPEKQVKIATRNTWIDEKGRQRKAKADILDDNGELRPGCRIVKKGEEIYSRAFFDKRMEFSEKWHTEQMKQDCCDWINSYLQPKENYIVFDPTGPYLAQKKVGKGNEKKEDIERFNRNVRKITELIDRGVLSEEEGYRIKDRVMCSPDQNAALQDAVSEIDNLRGNESKIRKSEKIYPEMNEKQRLYQRSNVAWNRYNEAKALGLPKEVQNKYLSEARHASADIDRYKRENGLYQDKDYIKLIKSYKAQMARKKAEIERYKNQEKKAWVYYCNYTRGKEVFNVPEYDIVDEKYWKLKNWWRDSRWSKIKSKKELKALKEEFKAAKKEFRQHKKIKKTTEISGLINKIQGAAGRSGSPGTTKPQRKDREAR